ncbi:hypothetical protein V2K69_14355 [Pseudomonas alliivorans]|nr:hypothetical protein [Pseudomonas alliivorans]MEE4722233.1 hypothetical protein [Pseudomonas alliivorans]MEE4757969.1 hypothetical protein [Pseudomonas alliivorans]MEE4762802.1 hypothetical protein [Pseudomonas alliivorans]MEE4773474.1 hypothetical protein [Pseudomonas alliivorans]
MTSRNEAGYAASAYRSDNSNPMPRSLHEFSRGDNELCSMHIKYGHYAGLDPAMEITTQLEAKEHERLHSESASDPESNIYCNHKRWRFQNSSNFPHLLFVTRLMSYSLLWMPWGLGVFLAAMPAAGYGEPGVEWIVFMAVVANLLMILSLAMTLSGNHKIHYMQFSGLLIFSGIVLWVTGTLWGTTEMHISFWIGTFLYFMGAIGCDAVLYLYSLFSKHDGSEFNRIDGMVRFKRRFRTLFVAPFEEFDPVLRTIPTGHGSHDYVIWLYHRYTNKKLCLAVKVHALGLDKVNALAFWDSLQRYMDVTHPLPDLPVLEQSRHLDPVTAAHDARTGRPERRWRDQSIRSWKAAGEKRLTEQLKRHPWQQSPCIVRARISDTLNIEDYYRSLEAEGIDISPKADNFSFLYQMDQGAQ